MGAGYAAVSPTYCGQVTAASDDLRGLIRSVIEDTAATGNVVIVAHAASLALASRGDVFRVLITASMQTRQRRLATSLGVDVIITDHHLPAETLPPSGCPGAAAPAVPRPR